MKTKEELKSKKAFVPPYMIREMEEIHRGNNKDVKSQIQLNFSIFLFTIYYDYTSTFLSHYNPILIETLIIKTFDRHKDKIKKDYNFPELFSISASQEDFYKFLCLNISEVLANNNLKRGRIINSRLYKQPNIVCYNLARQILDYYEE